jgi:hypothetical protein
VQLLTRCLKYFVSKQNSFYAIYHFEVFLLKSTRRIFKSVQFGYSRKLRSVRICARYLKDNWKDNVQRVYSGKLCLKLKVFKDDGIAITAIKYDLEQQNGHWFWLTKFTFFFTLFCASANFSRRLIIKSVIGAI